MTSELYYEWRVIELVESELSEFGHRFGGPIQHQGLVDEECGLPCHLLYWLNLEDPELAIRIPGVQWLPLYYCFCYENQSMRTSYRVLSDSRVEGYFDRERIALPAGERFPDEEFPAAFPETSVILRSLPFDPSDLQDIEQYVNAFGIERLSAVDRSAFLNDYKNQWDTWAAEPWSGPLDGLLDTMAAPCPQGPPRSACPNPQCSNHARRGSLQLFALIPSNPVSDCSLSGKYGDDTVILYEICPLCSAITATNQCT